MRSTPRQYPVDQGDVVGQACAATIARRVGVLVRCAPDVVRFVTALGGRSDDVVMALQHELDAVLAEENAFDLLDSPTLSDVRRRADVRIRAAVRSATAVDLQKAV